MDIKGKIAVIAGGSSGIGKATALALAKEGAGHIVLLARRQEKLDRAAAEIEQAGTAVSTYSLNLGDSQAVQAVAQQIKTAVGVPDIIVNSAGGGELRSLAAGQDDDIIRHIESTCYAAFFLSRAFLPEMLARNSGTLVFVGSPATSVNTAAPAYMASRAAVRTLARSIRFDLSNSRLRVLYAEPTLVYNSDYFVTQAKALHKFPVLFHSDRFRFLQQDNASAGRLIVNGIRRNRRYSGHWVSWLLRLTGPPFMPLYEWFFKKLSLPPEQGGPLFPQGG